MRSLFLEALHCSNKADRPPVWLMRQAGRYMPQYRALREKYTLWQLFHETELAAEVSLLPLELLDVDAAILFSDILVIAEALGLSVVFPEKGGPRVEPAIRNADQADALPELDVEEVLSYAVQTVRVLKPRIAVPLIGFCGGPFTVASYLIDSNSKEEFQHTKAWMQQDPESFHRLLAKIARVSIAYLQAQVCAGADAVQIFDSWASILTQEQFQTFCLPYLKQMIDALEKTGIPVILFCRNSSLYPKELAQLEPRCISFDWLKSMSELRRSVPDRIAVQGNIDPQFLKNPKEQICSAVSELLLSMKGEPGFIVNLGHGVLPDIPLEHVQCFVDAVKNLAGP